MGINELYGKQVQYCSNRKEAKDHGADAGMLLGAELKDGQRVVMVEDVTTSGKSIEETYPLITSIANIEVVGLIVSLNRMEVGKGGKVAALQEVSERWGMPTAAIVSRLLFRSRGRNRHVLCRTRLGFNRLCDPRYATFWLKMQVINQNV